MNPIIEVRSKTDVMEKDLRQFAERRVSFALDHLRRIRRVCISVEDVNGPKGGVDKRCRICATLGFAPIVLEETQTDWQVAVARAIHRLDRTATERLQRMKQPAPQKVGRVRHRATSLQDKLSDPHKSQSDANGRS